jgi:L-ribulose-5-phosphate 3-epimerase UlaE
MLNWLKRFIELRRIARQAKDREYAQGERERARKIWTDLIIDTDFGSRTLHLSDTGRFTVWYDDTIIKTAEQEMLSQIMSLCDDIAVKGIRIDNYWALPHHIKSIRHTPFRETEKTETADSGQLQLLFESES